MSDIVRLLLLLVIAGGITFLSRELPFLLFRSREIPSSILYLGKVLPMAIMSILVLYCIKDTAFDQPVHCLPQLIALTLVTLLHLWKRNTTLSILVGTVCYMVLLRLL